MATPRTKTSTTASATPAASAERAAAPARHAASAAPAAPAAPAKKAAKTPARRGPRRTPAVRPGGPGEIDLEALRSALKATIAEHHPTADLSGVDRAFDLAVEAHKGQPRATGEPYVTHPIASAQIVADLGIDPVAVEAALLHDVPEDTEYSLTDIEERFGAEVAHLVDGVTKLSRFSTHSHEQQQAENIRKMLLAMAEDIRVVLIKLADRLHNMRTLYGLPSEKQLRIARQTMEIYAPLAERLGIWQIKWELEDLAFKVLEPERFRELAKLLDTRRKGRESYIDRAIAELTPRLEAAGIDADLQGRPKHIYSIWKKMQRKGAEFGEIYDVYAIRVLVDEVRDCYAALGIVHSLWRPIPGQFDDYIAVPKNNLYQSLHTAVIALDGKPLEIQIRTTQMHQISEVGIAAHWRYKEGTKSDREYDAKLAWLRQLMDWQREVSESDATEFVEGIKLDIFQDQVFVFTPKGDIKDLPAGRDAARLRVPHPHRRRPPDDRREDQQPARPARLSTEERRHRRDRHDQGRARPVARLAERRPDLSCAREDPPMVQAQGPRREHRPRQGVAGARAPASRADDDRGGRARQDRRGRESAQLRHRRTTSTPRSATARSAPRRSSCASVSSTTARASCRRSRRRQHVARTGGVRVKGVGDLLVRFAKCCHPIPGDPIVGFITRGKGVTVHLRSCPTVANEREISRLIEVEWEAAPTQTYPIAIRVEAYDRTGSPQRHHPGRRREQGQHRGRVRRRHSRTTRRS